MDDASGKPKRAAQAGQTRRGKTRARIVAAAFELFGSEEGLNSRIEDIARLAGVTRATFYNHFGGMAELRDAVSYELTHDYVSAVIRTLNQLDDPRQRTSGAIRLYLHRAREHPQWAWSIINISVNGIMFGAESYHQAEQWVVDGMEAAKYRLRSSALGRDVVLGTCLAATFNMMREHTPRDFPELIAGHVLMGLGVPFDEAKDIANLPLPSLDYDSQD